MAKIQNYLEGKQIIVEQFYIDSAKFLIDSDLFSSINIPNKIIEIDAETGEQLREFKRKSLQVDYKGFIVYVSNYTKILRGKHYDKFMLLFSAKVSNRYLAGIRKDDFVEVMECLKNRGLISYDNIDNLLDNIYTKDTDIAYNILVPKSHSEDIIEQWKLIRANSDKKDSIKIGKAKDNQMIQFGKRGDKYFFKIYNKTLEITKELDEFMLLPLTDDERALFINSEYYMYRIEITIRNKADFKSLNTSSKLLDLWQLLDNNNDAIKDIVKKYFDVMTGTYTPKIRDIGKLSPTDKVILAFLVKYKSEGKTPIELMNLALSLFESNSNLERKTKSRAKKKVQTLIDYMYLNEEDLKEQQSKNAEAYSYIEKMFFLN